jgi:hypothetical protein
MNRGADVGSTEHKWDRRLIGTWKSDRRRTFAFWKPGAGYKVENVPKLKALFGKLTIRWGRGKFHTEYKGYRETCPYEIVARDSDSVVIRCWCSIFEEYRVRQIHFDGDYYYVAVGPGLIEHFRQISIPVSPVL